MTESHEFDLVMPFVTVGSKGGPHDDESYTAGYEMGLLDAELAHAAPAVVERPIHAANTAQADLLAMKHGYRAETGDETDGWVPLLLTRNRSAP